MKKMYSLIWNQVKKSRTPASKTIGRKSSAPLWFLGLLAMPAALLCAVATAATLDPGALPTGGTIVAGSGVINQAGTAMTINQTSQRMIANWSTFNIGQNASVTFQQPNASAIALNRIQDQNPSQIFGSLSANGQVWLMNPSGILFGSSATVNVGGLVASSLNITDENFLSGRNLFEKVGTAGAVRNRGTIRTTDGGYVAFLAPRVKNKGSLTAPKGTVVLAAAEKVSLDFRGDRLITYTVDRGAVDALAKNSGLIKADGGLVIMTALAAHDLTGAVVNNSGVIEAQTLENKAGRILLLADMKRGETIVGGRLDASAPNGGDGGFIETSAARVTVSKDVQISTRAPRGKTGEWLIDPVDITIAAFGGDISGATIATALQSTDVTLDTTGAGTCTGAACGALGGVNGDITINDDINITGDLLATRTLKLIAERDIILKGDKKIDATLGGNTRALNVIFNADSNADQVGGVTLEYNSAIKSNGGNIVMGGGVCTAAGCSAPAYGTGAAGTGGITIDDGGFMSPISLLSGNGAIWMWGSAPTAGGAGIHLKNAIINSGAAGSVYLKGAGVYDSGNPNDGNGFGLFVNGSTITAGSAGMTLNGTGADTSLDPFAPVPAAIGFTNTASAYTTNSGTLTVNANSPGGVYISTNSADDLLGHATLQNGNMVINYTGTGTGGLPNIKNPAGNLTVNSLSSGVPITDGGNTQTISGTTSIDANSGSVALGTGGGTFTTGTLTISNGLSVGVVNTGALTLGAINSGSDPIDIATTTGNLTLTGVIGNTNTTTSAIKLNAGSNTAAGTATGGSIIVNGGSLSMGAGGRATLYSGSVADSTGLTALIGSGSGKFRYNSDESATNFTTALGAGSYAVYRQRPTVTVTANDASKTYDGVAYSGGNGVTSSGFVNGDTAASFGGVLSYGGTSQGATSGGSYVITPSGYTNGLGYALAYANGTLTINSTSSTSTVPPQAQAAVTAVTAAVSGSQNTGGSSLPGGVNNSGPSGSVIAPPPPPVVMPAPAVTVPVGNSTTGSSGGVAVLPSPGSSGTGSGTGTGTGSGTGSGSGGYAPNTATGGTLTSGGGFSVSLAPAGAAGGDALLVNRGLTDQVVQSGTRSSFTVPSDAFAHTDRNAMVTLTARQANGAPLPSWIQFNALTGSFNVQPPPGITGSISLRVIARDSQGHEVVATMKIRVSNHQDGGSSRGD